MSDPLERFIDGVVGDGVDQDVFDETVRIAPRSDLFGPRLLDAIARTSGKGVYAAACLAMDLSADPGYRLVLEAILRTGRARAFAPSLLVRGRTLRGDGLAWWFDLVSSSGNVRGVNDLIFHRAADLLVSRRDAVIDHFLTRVDGPAFMAADAIEAVWLAGGPCRPLEELWARWIDDARFDRGIDSKDGSTSPQFLAGPLENCVREGRFDDDWWLLDHAARHYRTVLSSTDDEVRRRGLSTMATLLRFRHDLEGRLPAGVLSALPPGSPAATAIEEGFDAVAELKRHPGRSSLKNVIDDARWTLLDEVETDAAGSS